MHVNAFADEEYSAPIHYAAYHRITTHPYPACAVHCGIAAGARWRALSPAFLFAALLWHEVLASWMARQKTGERPIAALHAAMDEVLERQRTQLAIPRRYDAVMKELWLLQPRFAQRSGQRPVRLLTQARFRGAFDFLLLRCESGEVDAELGAWWTEFQQASDERRAEMLMADEAPKKPRRRKKKNVPTSGMEAQTSLPIE